MRVPKSLKLVLDSGASLHVIKKRDLKKFPKGIFKMKHGPVCRVQTANGIVSSDLYYVFVVPTLGKVEGLVLDETPDLFSMGCVVRDHEMAFVWWEYDKPLLYNKKTGQILILKVEHNVPVLDLENIEVIQGEPGVEFVLPAKRLNEKTHDPEFVSVMPPPEMFDPRMIPRR